MWHMQNKLKASNEASKSQESSPKIIRKAVQPPAETHTTTNTTNYYVASTPDKVKNKDVFVKSRKELVDKFREEPDQLKKAEKDSPVKEDPKPIEKTPCRLSIADTEGACINITDEHITVWAKLLLDHKGLNNSDRIGLKYYFKNQTAINHLESAVFKLAAQETDVSYITIASDIVGQIDDLFGYTPL